jgi:hypothetical protein
MSASERAAAVQASGAQVRRNYNSVNAVSVNVPNAAVLTGLQNNPRVLSVRSADQSRRQRDVFQSDQPDLERHRRQ